MFAYHDMSHVDHQFTGSLDIQNCRVLPTEAFDKPSSASVLVLNPFSAASK
jgi:hypothetical protein